MKRAILVLAVTLLATATVAREPRKDQLTGRIRVLYIGDAWGPTPFFHIEAEPSFVATPVPATYVHVGTYGDRQLRQFMRIYMPRSFGELTASYDLVILSDTNRGLFISEQLQWFKQGVHKQGIGLMMVGGVEAFGGEAYPTWGGSAVEESLPVLCVDGQTFRKDFKVTVNYPDDPFIKSLPWKTMPFFHGMNVVTAKGGSKILLGANLPPNHPVLVYWEFGNGSSLAHAPDWTPAWGSSIMYYWDYYSDYIANLNYLTAGTGIPQEPELMHRIRNGFRDYALNRALSLSLMEFVEKFGARISLGEERLSRIGSMEERAEELYIAQAYDEVLTVLDKVKEEFEALSLELIDLKDRALLWIYIVEWSAVSGTAVACGFTLWSLMIRRHLYREAGMTRAQL